MSRNTKTKSASGGFLKGAMILTISMVAVKLCGMAQKILLTNLYGVLGGNYAEFGTALFANAYELYVPLYTLATIGFPVAVSRLVSESYAKERYNDIKQIYKVSKPFFIIMGLVFFLIMTVGSFFYVQYIQSPYSQPAMLVLAPTIFFGCLVSIYRGYYQGLRNMTPTALSEFIEAVSKIAIGVVLSYIIVYTGKGQFEATGTIFGMSFDSADAAYRTLVSISVAASIFGITMGSVLAFVYLRVRFALTKGDIPQEYYARSLEAVSKRETFRKMYRTALPIGVGALVMSLSSTVDATIIQNLIYNMALDQPHLLLAEYNHVLDTEIATDEITIHTCIWGYYSAALTLTSIVVSVTQAFGTSAMPNVTDAYTKGNKEELASSMETILRLTSIVAFPCGVGLAVLAGPILGLVFFTNPNIATFGAESLQVLGIATLFMGLLTPICSMLQGIGKVKHTMYVYIFGMTLKVIVSYLFARNVYINIVGAAIGTTVCYLVMCVVSMYMLIRGSRIRLNFASVFLKPLASAAVCGVCAYVCYYLLGINVVISIGISAIFYIASLFILHTFSRNEIIMLPKGKKIVIILEKLHLIR